ncbi:substrate-binding periplasmic protein [Thalassotalea euphylliae]|uniref:substrate-binding periplasmic protein n=1 Tax=Thalassotalea euphylliae TaxID=1655234 RepID=UPI0036364DCE
MFQLLPKLHIIFGFLCCIATAVVAEEKEGPIELVAGLAKPPFIIQEGKTGIQLEIISAAFAEQGEEVVFSHVPLSRNITAFQQWHIDGVITLPVNYRYPGMYISEPYIDYQNVAVSLDYMNISINNVKDLQGRSVIAFQNAKKFLGDEYKETVSYLLEYRELANQEQQIKMLFSGRTEVIILDRDIFRYFVKTHPEAIYQKAVRVHPIFPKRPYAAGFKSEELKSIFDAGVEKIKENGTYQALISKYH